MKFKALLVVALFLIAAISFYTTDAEAQFGGGMMAPPEVIIDQYVDLYYSADYREIDDGSRGWWNERSQFLWEGVTAVGIKQKRGNTEIKAAMIITFVDSDDDDQSASYSLNNAAFGAGNSSITPGAASIKHKFNNGVTLELGRPYPTGIYSAEAPNNFTNIVPSVPEQLNQLRISYGDFTLGVFKAHTSPGWHYGGFGQVIGLQGQAGASVQDPSTDTRIPAFKAFYTKITTDYSVFAFAAYQYLKFTNVTAFNTTQENTEVTHKTLHAYGAGLHFGYPIMDFKIEAAGCYYVNGGDMGVGNQNRANVYEHTTEALDPRFTPVMNAQFASSYIDGDELVEADKFYYTQMIGAWLTIAYNINSEWSASAGFGYAQAMNELWKDENDVTYQYFVKAKYYIARAFSVSPSITVQDGFRNTINTTSGNGILGEGKVRKEHNVEARIRFEANI